MDELLAAAFSIADEDQKLEHYKHILSSILSSNNVDQVKKFIDHVLSDDVPWLVSRQLLHRIALGIATWNPFTQMDIVDYALGRASEWEIEEVIELFNIGKANVVLDGDSEDNVVRPPLPVVRDTLYGDAMLYDSNSNSEEEIRRLNIWEKDQLDERSMMIDNDNPRDNLASLYRPPFHLMFNGSFEVAKAVASAEDKWLLVNLQSTKEFSSHMLNRDTWGNETVAQIVSSSFIFWQVYDDKIEGMKVCTYYKLESIPAVLVIDPITGQKMRSWCGMVEPDSLLEDLDRFMDKGPRDHLINLSRERPKGNSISQDEVNGEDQELQMALAASLENVKESSASTSKKPNYPPLPEEPKDTDRNLLCRIGVRLPDGRRVQRNFLKTDPIQLLWSFCCSHLEEAGTKVFRLKEAIHGAKSCLDYDAKLTFGESGLANSMITVAWA